MNYSTSFNHFDANDNLLMRWRPLGDVGSVPYPDDPPETDAQKIARLEREVAALRNADKPKKPVDNRTEEEKAADRERIQRELNDEDRERYEALQEYYRTEKSYEM